MQRLTIFPSSINTHYIERAVEAICDGGVIIYPTDTLYAMGCDALSQKAVERLCAAKGINPAKQMLSVICSDLSMAALYARIDNRAFQILKRNTPGPFTFVLPAAPTLPKAFKGRKTVGIRIPDNEIARAITEMLGHPVLSASIASDGDEIITPDQLELIPALDAELLIDGGDSDNLPSTVVDLTDSSSPEIIRQGKGELL
ncbi:MAG: L-threonylcarbamoyladenylate synthase [Muribaculaceae bacterium]